MMRVGTDKPDFTLVLLDIEHFKKVDDNFGHLLGDKFICFVGGIIKKCVKGKDLESRYGGEEFTILLPDTDHRDALVVAENIRATTESGKLVRSDTRKLIGTITASLKWLSISRASPTKNSSPAPMMPSTMPRATVATRSPAKPMS